MRLYRMYRSRFARAAAATQQPNIPRLRRPAFARRDRHRRPPLQTRQNACRPCRATVCIGFCRDEFWVGARSERDYRRIYRMPRWSPRRVTPRQPRVQDPRKLTQIDSSKIPTFRPRGPFAPSKRIHLSKVTKHRYTLNIDPCLSIHGSHRTSPLGDISPRRGGQQRT